MKKAVSVFLAYVMIFQLVSVAVIAASGSADDISFVSFEDMAVNYVPKKEVKLTSTDAVYVDTTEEGVNKALKFVLKGTQNGVSFKSPESDTCATYTVSLAVQKGISGTVSLLNASGSATAVLAFDESGVLKTNEGKNAGCTLSEKQLVTLTLACDVVNKRVSVYVNGIAAVHNWYIDALPMSLGGLAVDFSEANDSKLFALVDSFGAGNNVMADKLNIPKVAYNTDVLDPVALPSDSDGEDIVGSEVLINSDLDSEDSLRGFTLGEERHNIERVYDEKKQNGYILIEGLGESTTARVDVSAKASSYMVIEADLMLGTPGVSGQLLALRKSGLNYTLKLTKDGTVQTHGTSSTICKLSKSKWTTVSIVCNLKKMIFDVYADGKLVKSEVAVNPGTKENFTLVRAFAMTSESSGSLYMDNVRIYEGKELRTLSDTPVVKEEKSVMPDGTEAISALGDSVALSQISGAIYAKGSKQQLANAPYVKDGYTLLPVRAVSEAFDLEVGWDDATGKVTIGDSATLTVGSQTAVVNGESMEMPLAAEVTNGSAFIPLRFLCENILGKNVMYDNRGFCIISNDRKVYTDTELWNIHDYLLYDRPAAQDILSLFNQESAGVHPRVIINNEDIETIRYNYNTKPYYKAWLDSYIAQADKILGYKPVDIVLNADKSSLESVQEVLSRVMTLSFAYFITEDPKYPQRVWKELESAGNRPDWNHQNHYLDTGEMMAAFAIGYDWLYDSWTDNQKKFLEEQIKEKGLEQSRKFYYGVQSSQSANFPRLNTNWNAVCNGGTALAAMAVMDIWPELTSDMLEKALRGVEKMNREFYPSGAWYEGSSYWRYLFEYFSMWARTMERTLGTDFNISKAPSLDISADYIVSIDGPEGTNNFHDAGQGHAVYAAVLWFAERFGRTDLVGERLMAINNYGMSVKHYDILYWPAEDSSHGSSFSKDMYFPGVEVVAMRSEYGNPEATYLSYHAGEVTATHSHIDAGTFVFDMSGVRWAIDLGTDAYTLPGYFSTGRNNIYRIRAEGHNVPVIDPDEKAGQNLTAVLPVETLVSAESNAYSVTDLTDAYIDYCSSVKRGYMLGEGRRTVTVRDEYEFINGSHDLYWFMHTKADVEIVNDTTAILTQEGKRLKAELVTNIPDARLSVMAAQPLPTSPTVAGQATNADTVKLTVNAKASGSSYIQLRFTDCDDYLSEIPAKDMPISTWEPDNSPVVKKPVLNSIAIDGTNIEDFDGNITSYKASISFRRDKMPTVTATASDDCIIEITDAKDETQNTCITVSYKNNPKDSRVYLISYKEELTSNESEYEPIAVTASNVQDDEHTQYHARDNDFSTRWSSDGEGQWMCLEFAQSVPIELVRVAAYQATKRTTSFDLEVSDDGITWTKVLSHTTDGVTDGYEYIKLDAKGRYIRLVGHGNSSNTWNSILEFGVVDTSQW